MQPLHVGCGSDKGGNTYQVNCNSKGTNLHAIWDSRIIEVENITIADLTPKPENLSNKNFRKHITDPADFMAFLKMSRDQLPHVYELKNHKLDDAYMKENRSLVINQLRYGAILLTNCLESLILLCRAC